MMPVGKVIVEQFAKGGSMPRISPQNIEARKPTRRDSIDSVTGERVRPVWLKKSAGRCVRLQKLRKSCHVSKSP